MKYLQRVSIAIAIFFTLPFAHAQSPAESCDTLLKQLEQLGAKQDFMSMLPLLPIAEASCKTEYGEYSRQYGEAISYFGVIQQTMGNYEASLQYYLKQRDIWNIIDAPRNDSEYGIIQSNIGQNYIFLGNMPAAMAHNDSAIVIAREIAGENSPSYANRLINKGLIFFKQGPPQLDSAEYYLQTGVAILRNNNDVVFLFKGLNSLSFVLREKGKYPEAISCLKEACQLAIMLVGEDHQATAILKSNIAVYTFESGEYFTSEGLAEQAINAFRKAGLTTHPIYTKMLINQVMNKNFLGKYDQALELSRELQGTAFLSNAADSAEHLSMLGILYQSGGNEMEAITLFKQAAQLFEDNGRTNTIHYIQNLNNLGWAYQKLGDYEKAILFQEKALSIYRGMPKEPSQQYAILIQNLALSYMELRRKEEALKLLDEALHTASRSAESTPILAAIYYSKGFFYNKNLEFAQARKSLVRSLRILEKTTRPENISYCLNLQGLASVASATGHSRKAAQLYEKAISYYKKGGNEHTENFMYCLFDYAIYNARYHNNEKALTLLKEAQGSLFYHIDAGFSFLSEAGKEQFLQKNENYFQDIHVFTAANAATLPPSAGLAFDNELALKGMLLNSVQSISTAIRTSGDTVLSRQLQEWKATKQVLARQFSLPVGERLVGPTSLDSLVLVAKDQEEALARESEIFRNARMEVHWQQVRDRLHTGEAAIEFIRYRLEDKNRLSSTVHYGALILRPGDMAPVYVPLFRESELEALLNEASMVSKTSERVAITYLGAAATPLYRLIWKPIAPFLAGITTIYYAPTGLLHRLSFPAIGEATGKPLLAFFDLRLVASTRELLFSKNNLPGQQIETALLLGGIEYAADSACLTGNTTQEALPLSHSTMIPFAAFLRGGCGQENIPSLPGTGIETNKLYQLLHTRARVSLLQGCAAKEEEIKALGKETPSPEVLHIATHGFFCETPDLGTARNVPVLFRSGLLLAGAQHTRTGGKPFTNLEDGVLFAYEVADLNLSNTRLVVLSACETALGDIRGSEGVYGLARSFLLAGADQVMMSLWQINDQETARFMERFYQKWLGGQDIREAFRDTQLDLKKEGIGEEVWGAFVLL